MNHHFTKMAAVAAILALGVAAPVAAQDRSVPVHATASVSADTVVLDVFADCADLPMRGFGFQVRFAPTELSPKSGGCYKSLWFLQGESGARHPYTDLTVPQPGRVRVVGGRLDGANPKAGIAADNLLLATLVLERLTTTQPKIELAFASPAPYANFASASGDSLDSRVEFRSVAVQPAPEDSDADGLPDHHELSVYGDLATSDGTTDTDGDGDDDAGEWLRGTDPTDPASKFRLEIEPQPDGSKLVVWTGGPGRVYDLEWSRGLGQFEVVADGIPGGREFLEALDAVHNNDPDGFYRIRTRFPTAGR